MPIYPFYCPECNNSEEVICSYSERDKYKECPVCGASRDQVLEAPNMVVIHDLQGKGDLYHKRVSFKGGGAFNTTNDGVADNEWKKNKYFYKNNPSEDPRVIQRKMESNESNKK